MFSKEERLGKKIIFRDTSHFYQRLHEKGKNLFGDFSPDEMAVEILKSFKNPNRSIIVEDNRKKDSTHHCIFITDKGEYACVPFIMNGSQIILLTVTDIKQDNNSPLWYVRNYNEIAKQRNMNLMSYWVK